MGLIRSILLSQVEKEEGDFASYIRKLEKGEFVDKMFYGIAEDRRGFLTADPVQQPGALYCGGMGSGKSIAMRSTLITHMAANSENTIYLLVDAFKGMTDYSLLFDYKKNVAVAINDTAKLIPVIEMLYAECMARKNEFSKVNGKEGLIASNIYDYDRLMKIQKPGYPGLARIVLAIEEFHAVPNAPEIKFYHNVDRPGSPAAMLKDLMKVGRSYGISLLAATQRATSDDFPSALKTGITQLMAFRVNNPGDANAINLPQAQDILMEQRGRCAYEGGFIQFPYIDDKTGIALLKKYYKPLKAKLLAYSIEDYNKAFEGEGNEGMVQVKTFSSLIENNQAFSKEAILKRLLQNFNFVVRPQNNKALNFTMLAERGDQKYSILIANRANSTKKSIESFKEGSKMLGYKNLIVASFEGMISADLERSCDETGGYHLDLEDLQKIASILDNKEQLISEGKFDQMYNSISLVEDEVVAVAPEEKIERPKISSETEMINLKDELRKALKGKL